MFTLRVLLRMGALLNTTNIMIRECFHLHSLFRIRRRFTHENMFRQQQKLVVSSVPFVGLPPPLPAAGTALTLPPVLASNASAVISGGSPMTHAGKSRRAILPERNPYHSEFPSRVPLSFSFLLRQEQGDGVHSPRKNAKVCTDTI